ncbi:hypothetical protein [Bifidobacterium cuniculi]|uniref:Bacteriocin, lactococcin 972 family n=1 Tax=Bifidobacterium cuniculi TaxID=1688 RepID=A0A087AYD5_9BIFI|nr:hypothetical protein [Bifidobacterium cuniculi]KFI63785.1 hypothetical protein BCUN_1267 [Bifidobacterium cuniculi]
MARLTRSKPVRAWLAALLAAGLAFSVADVAQAASATYYPVSSGQIQNGYFYGNYAVTANRSYIKLYSGSNGTHCYAHQDGNANAAHSYGSPGVGCEAVQNGSSSTVGDYASYTVI